MKTFLYLLIFMAFLMPGFAHAQSNIEDVIYLKNGSIYRGTIIEQIPNQTYKIEIMGGSVIVLKADDVSRIVKEEKKEVAPEATGNRAHAYTQEEWEGDRYRRKSYPVRGYKDKGGFLQMQFCAQLYGGGFRMIGGYKINQFAMLGIGVGIGGIARGVNTNLIDNIEPYNGFYAPFFLYYSGDILKKNITPFYAIEIGYGVAASTDGSDGFYTAAIARLSGGVMGSAGFGARFYTGRKFVLSLSAAFDFQQAHTHVYNDNQGYSNTDIYSSAIILLPAFKIGIGFIK